MVLKCCVPKCSSRNRSTLLHVLPKDPELYLRWLSAIGRQDLCEQPSSFVRRQFRICNAHFSEEQFVTVGKQTKLKKTSVPNLKCPCESPQLGAALEPVASGTTDAERFEISWLNPDTVAAENADASSAEHSDVEFLVLAVSDSDEDEITVSVPPRDSESGLEELQLANIDDSVPNSDDPYVAIEDVEYEVELVFSNELDQPTAKLVPRRREAMDREQKDKIFKCPSCSKNFRRKFTLTRHIRTVHRANTDDSTVCLNSEVETYECASCSRPFKRKDNLRRHITMQCGWIEDPSSIYKCPRCDAKFVHKHHMKRHLDIHTAVLESGNKKCSLCDAGFKRKADVLFHLENRHRVLLQREKLEFSSEATFNAWKKDLELRTCTHYRQCNFNKNKIDEIRVFTCHRSGAYVSAVKGETRSRRMKYQGSKKINCFCPGEIKLKKTKLSGNREVCHAYFTKTHIGHETNELELYHVPLALADVKRRSSKKDVGVPRRDILSDFADNSDTNELGLITSDTPRNTEQPDNVAERIPPGTADSLSVDTFVATNASSILYLKNQGEFDDEHPEINAADFILVIMSKTQQKNLRKFGHDVIAVDGSHGVRNDGFGLLTLLVVDDFREGYPVAFAVTNCINEFVVNLFLACVADAVGVLKSRIFLSDVQDLYYDCWTLIMGEPEKRLYLTWHVSRAWRKHSNKIRNLVTRKSTLNYLNELILETDKFVFWENLKQFIANDDELMAPFLNYFKASYVKNAKLWAYCYRALDGINSSMCLKNLRSQLRYWFADGERDKELMHGLRTLDRFLLPWDNKTFVTETKERVGRKLKTIRRRHDNLERKFDDDYPDIFIDRKEANQWQISSVPHSTEEVPELCIVDRLQQGKCIECKLFCDKCDVCFHEYRCSCVDSAIENNMCKHIHLLGAHLQTSSPTATSPNDPTSRLSPATVEYQLEQSFSSTVLILPVESPATELKNEVCNLSRRLSPMSVVRNARSPSSTVLPVESTPVKLGLKTDDLGCRLIPEVSDEQKAPSSSTILFLSVEPPPSKLDNETDDLSCIRSVIADGQEVPSSSSTVIVLPVE